MSLARKASKGTLRPTPQDLHGVLDQKNTIITSLQSEVESLRANQQLYDRAREQMGRVRSRYESLVREQETLRTTNQERLDISHKYCQELRIQSDHIRQELSIRNKVLHEARFTSQQLLEYENKKQDETAQAKGKHSELKGVNETKRAEEERTRLAIAQMREEVDRGKKESSMVRAQVESLTDKCHKTQTYIRGLLREESSLNENLLRVEEENNKIDSELEDLDDKITRNKGYIEKQQQTLQSLQFQLANLELNKKKIENEAKDKVKQFSTERQRLRHLTEQHEAKKQESQRLDNQLQQSSEEVNYILAKNSQISQVNEQLSQDLKVCQRHQENVARVNKQIQGEIQHFMDATLKAIVKLKEPFTNKTNTYPTFHAGASGQKWTNTRSTGFADTGFERRTLRD